MLGKSGYVYWSTPTMYKDVKVGDRAFIWRTKSGIGPSGIIASGLVAEPPRQISARTLSLFDHPTRVPAAGWNETRAPLQWKTGIRIERVFWNAPLQVNFTASQGTVRRLTDEEVRGAERASLLR